MKWHDCKFNPPNKDGHYIIKTTNKYEEDWVGVIYYVNGKNINCYVNEYSEIGHWFDDYEEYIYYDDYAYKWAEINLNEEN